jgi:hypothetical protein
MKQETRIDAFILPETDTSKGRTNSFVKLQDHMERMREITV